MNVRKADRFLEVGCGAGLVAIAAARYGARVTATDISTASLRLARHNARRNQVSIRFVRADLLKGLRSERFETIAFNPPYLPTQREDVVPGPLNRAFDGGADGRRVVTSFLSQLSHAPPESTLLIASSLQDTQALEREFAAFGFDFAVRRTKAFNHESLHVYDLFTAGP